MWRYPIGVGAVTAAGGRDPDDVAAFFHEPLHLLDRCDVLAHLDGAESRNLSFKRQTTVSSTTALT